MVAVAEPTGNPALISAESDPLALEFPRLAVAYGPDPRPASEGEAPPLGGFSPAFGGVGALFTSSSYLASPVVRPGGNKSGSERATREKR
jgi:hypothetical protein